MAFHRPLGDHDHVLLQRLKDRRSGSAKDTRIQSLARVLYRHCKNQLSPQGTVAFFDAACRGFEAQMDEIRFRTGKISNDFETYLGIRNRTIALDPFFEVLKTDYLTEDERADPLWQSLQHHVCSAAGLQNDLVGLEKDLEQHQQLNGVLVLMHARERPPLGIDEADLARCCGLVGAEHNRNVASALDCFADIHGAAQRSATGRRMTDVAGHILLLCQTHLTVRNDQTHPWWEHRDSDRR